MGFGLTDSFSKLFKLIRFSKSFFNLNLFLFPFGWIGFWVFHFVVFSLFRYWTIIRTGITCKKIPCYMRNSACMWFIAKKLKYFEVMLNSFEFLIGLCNKLHNHIPNWHNKTKLVTASFSCFFNEKKVSYKVLLI